MTRNIRLAILAGVAALAATAALGSPSSGLPVSTAAAPAGRSSEPQEAALPALPPAAAVPAAVAEEPTAAPIVEPTPTTEADQPVAAPQEPEPAAEVPAEPPTQPAPTLCEQARPGALCPGDGQPAGAEHASSYDTDERGIYCPPDGASWNRTIWDPLQTWPDQFPVPGQDCDASLPVVIIDQQAEGSP